MNNDRRKRIDAVKEKLNDLISEIETLYDEEEEYRDNIPENMQGGDRYQMAEAAADNLQSAIDSAEEAVEYLESATE